MPACILSAPAVSEEQPPAAASSGPLHPPTLPLPTHPCRHPLTPHAMEAPQAQGPPPELQRDKPVGPLENVARTADFWRRTLVIYAGYKACQAQALALRAMGWDEARIKDEHWARQHSKAAQQMYSLCVDLRGFYLKVQTDVYCCPAAAPCSSTALAACC